MASRAKKRLNAEFPGTFQLYGQTYDAVAWAAAHPGGRAVIESVTCIDEVVAERIFETSHRYPAKNLAVLAPYAVKTDSPKSVVTQTPTPSVKEDPFFEHVKSEVYAFLAQQNPRNPRGQGQARALAKCALFAGTWAGLVVGAVFAPWPVLTSFLAGFVLLSWGFVQFHDSSHFAYAGGLSVNRLLTHSWCACSYWPPWLWHRHHVELHHGCAGDYERDPDLRHGAPFMRKTEKAPKERYLGLSACLQILAMAVAPGMYLGQTIHYATVRFGLRRALWKMQNLFPPPSDETKLAFWQLSVWFPLWVVFFTHRRGPLTALCCAFAFFAGANVVYAANILPDHDTVLSHKNLASLSGSSSWAAKQVAASANWAGPVWCFLFGGLNYQIEHHLFPRVHHSYYPLIAPIVQRACLRFHVPYVHYPSFLEAALAVHRQLCVASEEASS